MSAPEEPTQVETEPVEPRRERMRRHRHRARLYGWAFLLVALLVVVLALAIANTRQVRVSWVVGSDTASLVWIVLAAAVLGWLLGMTTSVVFGMRTGRQHPAREHGPHEKG
jgi:uncharacterized integral membrane protein